MCVNSHSGEPVWSAVQGVLTAAIPVGEGNVVGEEHHLL